MHVFSCISALCASGLLFAQFTTANPILTLRAGDRDLLGEKMPKDIGRGKCTAPNNYNTKEGRKQAWIDANGWKITDEYMNKNSATNWAQDMMQAIFPDMDMSNFACSDQASQCMNSKGCSEFEAKGWPGAFYVLSSIKNIHTYFSAYITKMDQLNDQLKTDVDTLVQLFGKDVPTAKALNLAAIFSGALAIASGATAPIAPVSGFLGANSGIATILAETVENEPKTLPELQTEAAAIIKEVIQGYINVAKNRANTIMDAIFGKGPNEMEIPKEMKFNLGENTDGWVHAITYVLGDGQWLSKDPITSMQLDSLFVATRKKMRQMIAFQLVRRLYEAVVVINYENEEQCSKKDGNQAWDPYHKWCYGMMWTKDGTLHGGINDHASPLWKSESDGGFGMDKLATYRNTYHCWVANNATVGNIVINDITPETDLPRCFFGMEMKKGVWVDDNHDCWPGATLKLDLSFPNFPPGQESRTHWPQETPSCKFSNYKGGIEG